LYADIPHVVTFDVLKYPINMQFVITELLILLDKSIVAEEFPELLMMQFRIRMLDALKVEVVVELIFAIEQFSIATLFTVLFDAPKKTELKFNPEIFIPLPYIFIVAAVLKAGPSLSGLIPMP
jgi:hypothetical protein